MIKLTCENIIELIDALYKQNKLPYCSGEILPNSFGYQFKAPLALYNLFTYNKPILLCNFDKKFFENHRFYYTALYHKEYTEAFGKEPFDLIEVCDNHIKVGCEYEYDDVHIICTSKKIYKNSKKLEITFYLYQTVWNLPFFNEKTTLIFDLNSSNPTCLQDMAKIDDYFKTKVKPTVFKGKLTLEQAMEKCVQLNLEVIKELEILNKNKDS